MALFPPLIFSTTASTALLTEYQPHVDDSNTALRPKARAKTSMMVLPFIGMGLGISSVVINNLQYSQSLAVSEGCILGMITGLKCGFVSEMTNYFIKDSNTQTELAANIAINGILSGILLCRKKDLLSTAGLFAWLSISDFIGLKIENYLYNKYEIDVSFLEVFQDIDGTPFELSH